MTSEKNSFVGHVIPAVRPEQILKTQLSRFSHSGFQLAAAR